jgi:hypothetical protein
MKQVRVVATFFLLCFLLLVARSSFASVVVGDDESAFALGIGSIFAGQSVAQSFTLTADTTVNQVDLGFLTFLTHSLSGAYPFTIHITNGLAAGSQELLTLNESISLPVVSPGGQARFSYGFKAVTLPTGTYYLILTSPYSLPSVEWEQDQIGSVVTGSPGPAYIDNGPELSSGWQVFPPDCPQNPTGLCTTNGIMAFNLDFVRYTVPVPPVGGALGQGVRLTVVAGPAIIPPGVPVEGSLGFVDLNGNAVGPSAQVSLNPGQTQSLEWLLPVQQPGQRVEVRPVVTQTSIDPSSPLLQASVEVFDFLSGYGTVLATVPATESPYVMPGLFPQGLAGGQTMRLNVVAIPPDPCIGQLSFVDKSGAPLGPTMAVNLIPGAANSLDLNADALGLKVAQHIEVQPMVSLTPSISAGPPITSSCQGSVEVFDHLTGRTWTFQTGLPAVQLPAVQ